MDNNKEKLHIAMFPWLAYGHIMPFFLVAKFLGLGSKGFVQLTLPHVDGLPLEAESTAELPIGKVPYLKKAYDLLQLPLTNFLQNSDVNWVILDFASYWLPSVASQLGVNSVFFNIFCASSCSFIGPPSELLNGRRQKPEDFTLHEIVSHQDCMDSAVSDFQRLGITIRDCRAFAVRSCPEFEPEAFSLLGRLLQKPFLPVGLLPPTLQDTASGDEKWQVFKDWLDSKREKSGVYVALGTEVTLSQELMHELAFGLEKSGLPFIWLVKNRPLDEGEMGPLLLPTGFQDGGWSSVIEALGSDRVLILLSRASSDTGLVARLIHSEQVRLETESVAESIRRVMVSQESEALRANAWDMKEICGNINMHKTHLNEFTHFIESDTTSTRSV
ncbi:hypothetical protein Ddye_020504 [Dipteronia dyeriana]|uniref:UDP-glycosyltransferase n=1 Tax=Dipteronia dyeriana TaxID=168575 RepID=A0AAD9TZU4_9ROSI|nr:hypothetical protein Ddye_020504 [Dipteronia dyeriana]